MHSGVSSATQWGFEYASVIQADIEVGAYAIALLLIKHIKRKKGLTSSDCIYIIRIKVELRLVVCKLPDH